MTAEPPIPDEPAHLLAVLREPRRLRILIALEHQPRSVVDLERALGLTYSEIHWAVKKLKEAGLVAVRADAHIARQGRGADLIMVYGTTHTGWTRILRALEAIAATSEGID